ncbi:MAG: hypothetical protein HY098_08185 [Nitrospinae bacterium]|nr:hypothetical protein [Nitrospinota bacterium]
MKILSFAVLGLFLGLGGFTVANGLFGVASAVAQEENTYLSDEIDFHFAQEKNMHHFTMLSGKLVDLTREQQRIFRIKNAAAENKVAENVEEFLNDANGSASRHDYEEAYVSLEKAYKLLQTSMQEMGVQKSRDVPSESDWRILK